MVDSGRTGTATPPGEAAMRHLHTALLALPLALGCATTPDKDGSAGGDGADGAGADGGSDGADGGSASGDGGSDGTDGSDGGDDTGPDALDCAEDIVLPAVWFDADRTDTLPGRFELGQTHVVAGTESRLAPPIVAERETLVLFAPDVPIADDGDLRISIWEGDTLLGTLDMAPPGSPPEILENGLTSDTLDPYSTTAWTAIVPWTLVQEGHVLRVGQDQDGELATADHVLTGLGAPHVLTLSRAKMVLFGDGDEDTQTLAGPTLLGDLHASVPGAVLRLVDYTPWRLDEIVINTADGPRRVSSEEERLSLTIESDRWSLLKHQFALRHSLANTGRGMVLTGASEGDSSPYSYGTSVVMGWVRDTAGNLVDINDSPYAAGWTGWSALWQGECGNATIHELGHSFTLAHFTSGTAASWGIDDEYPEDGVNLESHPWGWSSTTRQLRTWYRVDSNGAVLDGGVPVGKHDPMNGGESANALTCFPQYTSVYAKYVQDWQQRSPTLLDLGGVPGVYTWDAPTASYQPVEATAPHAEPTAVDVPVVLVVGTLGSNPEANQVYPPLFSAMGNVFDLAAPDDGDLDGVFDDARYFVDVHHRDGSSERALIAQGPLTDTVLHLFSFTVDASRYPIQVDLYRADTGYPDVDIAGATLLHSRAIVVPDAGLPVPLQAGRGQLANGALDLTRLCTEGVDCAGRAVDSVWRDATQVRHFAASDGTTAAPDVCLEPGDVTVLTVPVLDDSGTPASLVVHAQRVLRAGGQEVAVPLNDTTPWLGALDLEQRLRVWAPYAPNAGLPPGTYTTDGTVAIDGLVDGSPTDQTALAVQLQVHPLIEADVGEAFWTDPAVTQADSSVYFLVEDPAMGPTSGVWWDGDAVQLEAPVVDVDTGLATHLVLDAHKAACGSTWALNSGQSSDWNCDNHAVVQISPTGNEHLESGHTYESPGSSPLVIEAHRWHAPSAGALLASFALKVHHTAP